MPPDELRCFAPSLFNPLSLLFSLCFCQVPAAASPGCETPLYAASIDARWLCFLGCFFYSWNLDVAIFAGRVLGRQNEARRDDGLVRAACFVSQTRLTRRTHCLAFASRDASPSSHQGSRAMPPRREQRRGAETNEKHGYLEMAVCSDEPEQCRHGLRRGYDYKCKNSQPFLDPLDVKAVKRGLEATFGILGRAGDDGGHLELPAVAGGLTKGPADLAHGDRLRGRIRGGDDVEDPKRGPRGAAARLDAQSDGAAAGGDGVGLFRDRSDAPVGPGVAANDAEPGDAVEELDAGLDPLEGCGITRRGKDEEDTCMFVLMGVRSGEAEGGGEEGRGQALRVGAEGGWLDL